MLTCGRSHPPEGPVMQRWPVTLAGPSHEAEACGRRRGDVTRHARTTHDNAGAHFMPRCRS